MGNWAAAKTWVKLTTGTYLNSERNLGKERERRSVQTIWKKGQREKKGRESLSVSNHLPIAPHHKDEGLPSQTVIFLV